MRIDRLLYFLRLIKSRTQAQALVAEGRIRVDGKRIARASEEVRIGQVLALPLRGQVSVIRLRALPTRRGPPAEARAAYEEIDEGGAAQ